MNELLIIEPDNLKALYLRGQAFFKKNEFTAARADFETGLLLDPNNQIMTNYVTEIDKILSHN